LLHAGMDAAFGNDFWYQRVVGRNPAKTGRHERYQVGATPGT
jgi:hypothetical protein